MFVIIIELFVEKELINKQRGKFATFYRNFHLLLQFHRNKHLKNTATFTTTFWKSPREISNFRPQLSQKRPAKSWGDWISPTVLPVITTSQCFTQFGKLGRG